MTTNKRVVVVDYDIGNTASVLKVISALGASVLLSKDPGDIQQATHLILPGVGAFAAGMEKLRVTGILPLITDRVRREKIPFLGICLGMQLLARVGYEHGAHPGLGWINGDVRKIQTAERLPHVGWDEIRILRPDPLLSGLPDLNFYFVHSYALECSPEVTSAICDYGAPITAAVHQENIFGTQFHPEKSHISGRKVLENFLDYA